MSKGDLKYNDDLRETARLSKGRYKLKSMTIEVKAIFETRAINFKKNEWYNNYLYSGKIILENGTEKQMKSCYIKKGTEARMKKIK